MKTIIVNVPEKEENFVTTLLKKFHLKPHVVSEEEDQDLIARWIDKGAESKDVPREKVLATLKKHGVKI